MYAAMIKNGWVMPAKSQGIVTLDFMQKVRKREIWCPRFDQVEKAVTVCFPPPRKDMLDMIDAAIHRIIEAKQNTDEEIASLINALELIEKRSADTHWLVCVLCVIDPENRIFSKGYRYVRPETKKALLAMPLMNNDDGFYDDLPPLQQPAGKKRARMLPLSKREKQEMQLKGLQIRQEALAAKI